METSHLALFGFVLCLEACGRFSVPRESRTLFVMWLGSPACRPFPSQDCVPSPLKPQSFLEDDRDTSLPVSSWLPPFCFLCLFAQMPETSRGQCLMYSFFHQCLLCHFASVVFFKCPHFGYFQERFSSFLLVPFLSKKTILTLLAQMPLVSPQMIHSAGLKVWSPFPGVFLRCSAWQFGLCGPSPSA